MEVTLENSPNLTAGLNNDLGIQLVLRFERLGILDDLEEAIQVTRKAIKVTLENSPDLAARLNTLGIQLDIRFERLGILDNLEEAIRVTRKAIEVTPENSPNLTAGLNNNLGIKLRFRFERLGILDDLEEAIRVTRKAVEVTPENSPNLAIRLINHGSVLERRFQQHSHPADEEAAVSAFRRSYNCTSANPLHRLMSARTLLGLFKLQERWQDAATIAESAVKLLPLMHGRALSLQDQQEVLSNFSGLAVNACALHLKCNEGMSGNAEKALELLELGRGAIAGLVMDSQIDIAQLRASYPDDANRFEQLQIAINNPTTERRVDTRSPFELFREHDQCVQSIRMLPGHDRFLLAPSIAAMQRGASDGYVVLVNINDVRSDAILVSEEAIELVPLPNVLYAEAVEWAAKRLTYSTANESPQDWGKRNKQYRIFLPWLWKTCVEPILSAIDTNSTSLLPRVWWIGTGVASSLPFHAAGDLMPDSRENTISRVVSSYVPTVRSLLHVKERSKASITVSKNVLGKLLLVTMPTTPGELDLPCVKAEAIAVRDSSCKFFQCTPLDRPTTSNVLDELRSHDVVHFACHGVSHPEDPARSALILQRRDTDTSQATQDLLTVQQVLEMKSQPTQLAFLSACSTAEHKVARLADEVIHIASAFFIAGFSHVVGSMWPSNDSICLRIAEYFYTSLAGSGSRGFTKDLAYALHCAVLEVRSHNLKYPLLWAQHVHIGP